ncbi:serine/threonine protein kinase [Candidatus Uabimicrobium sp. HlEnr_7]|uniref:serine/threonine protein kinase n=1 Tax=Candidatus Uabimicrobium helgolandensis TaxID=3095367 RepID=UPI0035565857
MSSKQEILFGKTAVTMGLVTPHQLASFLQMQQKCSLQGKTLSLVNWLVEKKYITQSQVLQIKEVYNKDKSSTLISLNLKENSQFANYRIVRELGEGGMGKVFLVYDEQLQRHLALKILLVKDKNSIERFIREARTIAKLKHPNIVSIYHVSQFEDNHFYTMDYVNGPSLKELLDNKRLSTKQTVEILSTVGIALDYAHQQDVVHRDIKPSNIMIDQQDEVFIMDFGLAKLLDGGKQLSKSGTIIGTLYYMAPEQADGKLRDIDARTDVYALGVTMYQMLCGKLPFTGRTFSHVASKIVHELPISPRQLKKTIPQALNTICLKALEKSKEKRYQTAREFHCDLQNFLQGKRINARPPRKWFKWVISTIILFVSLFALFVISNEKVTIKLSAKTITKSQQSKKLFYVGDKVYLSIRFTPFKTLKNITIIGEGVKKDFFSSKSVKVQRLVQFTSEKRETYNIDIFVETENQKLKSQVEFFVAEKIKTKPQPNTSFSFQHILLYEGTAKLPPQNLRKYSNMFSLRTARYIYFEITFKNLLFQKRPNQVRAHGKYYTAQGQLIGTSNEISYIVEPNAQYAYITSSWGFNKPGLWRAGNFYIDVFVNDKSVGRAAFAITH